ncbi:MAG TPA: S41 family peptidase [Polyangiaceae bacterium]|nr:S41 family peptidase [Polyangiaceae bacterium]HQB44563.1 S41 family peptidase [Polyangiaceae bacterium]
MTHSRTKRRYGRGVAVASVAAAVWLTPFTASAIHFDPQGVLAFEPDAILTESFESFPTGSGIEVVEGDALDGKRYVVLRGSSLDDAAYIPLSADFSQQAYQVRAFVRGEHPWYPIVILQYGVGPGNSLDYITLSPTGRMTSDGWVEIESAPMSVDGKRLPFAVLMVISEEIQLDALEVTPANVAYQPTTSCSKTKPCGVDQVCADGYCRGGNSMVPALPSKTHRNLVVDVLQNKLRIAFGGVETRQQPLQQALAKMEAMRGAESSWQFWSTFTDAIHLLRDSHTTAIGLPSFVGFADRPFPICFVEGDADKSKTGAPSTPPYADVLVSHVGPYGNLGLKPGDRLVSVDGMHPVAWLRSHPQAAWIGYQATDPEVFSGEVESLPRAIPALASTIEVIRCNPSGTCAKPETIDLATLEGQAAGAQPECDHRPAYHLAANNPDPDTHDFDDVRFGLLADSAPGEDLYGMIWNDTDNSSGHQYQWEKAYSEFRTKAKGLILDHRRGDGGTAPGAAYLTELSRPPLTISVWSTIGTLGLFDLPFGEAEGKALFDLWKLDEDRAWKVGSTSPREDMRIAVLLARDVSGSDFSPLGVKGSVNTRLFGRRTLGAFSTFFTLEAQGFYYWSQASGDFVTEDGKTHIAHGVEPDVVLVPKQSDLMVGVDTVYERALAWVRCGKEVCP